jgi:hypothetical protein
MKKFIQNYKLFALILFSIVTLGVSNANSQTLYFCENVDANGYAIAPSSVFSINSSGGFLYFLVRLPYEFGSTGIAYDIYRVDSYGGESFDNTINQDAQKNWTWFYQKVNFYKAGLYNVYVYDGDRNFLTSGQVSIQYK